MDAKDKWVRIIQEYESSNMTKARFCTPKNMSNEAFQKGYYRYKKNESQRPPGPGGCRQSDTNNDPVLDQSCSA